VCAALFGYIFLVALVAAFTTGSTDVAAWTLGTALICMTLVTLATWYVIRQPQAGGYFLIALACLVATVLCFFSLLPLLVF
jgi:hypothetical protein